MAFVSVKMVNRQLIVGVSVDNAQEVWGISSVRRVGSLEHAIASFISGFSFSRIENIDGFTPWRRISEEERFIKTVWKSVGIRGTSRQLFGFLLKQQYLSYGAYLVLEKIFNEEIMGEITNKTREVYNNNVNLRTTQSMRRV